MHDHQNDSDSIDDSMERLSSFTCGVSAAPSAPALPAAEQLDRNPGVATRIMDKLKNMSRGRCWVLTTVCLGIICVLLVAVIIHQRNTIIHQQNKIKEQIDQSLKQTDNSNVFWVGSLIIKVAKLWIDPSGTLGTMLSIASEVVDVVK
ncbi:hypothetical protein R3I94_014097 [Phoxinus phoxinus]